MKVNIITNHTNGAGLQKDSDLLTAILTERGHSVMKIPFDAALGNMRRADVNFFLEVINPWAINTAPVNVLVPNSEWWGGNWDPHLPRFRWVLCKTRDCYDIWVKKCAPNGKQRCRYIGWEAKDYYQPDVPREIKFLHCAGKSETKNTAAVMEAWRIYEIPYPITVSAFKDNIVALTQWEKDAGVPEKDRKVTQVKRFAEADMPRIMNEHFCHVMPSKYEGYGMAIHEALGCSNLLITTDAPPMRDFSGIPRELLLPVVNRTRARAAFFNFVNPADICRMAHLAAGMELAQRKELGRRAREGFLKDRAHFQEALPSALKEMRL